MDYKRTRYKIKILTKFVKQSISFNTSKKISVDNNEYIRGPIELNDDFLYEINIDLN